MDVEVARDHKLTPEADHYFQIIKEHVAYWFVAKSIYNDVDVHVYLSTKPNGVCK